MAESSQNTEVMKQQEKNLNSIKELQDIQKKLFSDLEQIAGSQDINSQDVQSRIASIINQMKLCIFA